MFLGPLLLIVLIIGLILFFIPAGYSSRNTISHTHTPVNSNRALEILKERYAKGEISEEEYIRVKRNLE